MVVVIKVNKTPLDEVELFLRLAELKYPYEIKDKTNLEVSKFINNKFDIYSTEQQVNLLYEPDIDDMELDIRIMLGSMGLVY